VEDLLTNFQHIPVLLREVEEFLSPSFPQAEEIAAQSYKKKKWSAHLQNFSGTLKIIDGTFGGGGHAKRLVETFSACQEVKNIEYFGFDQDEWAISNSQKLEWLKVGFGKPFRFQLERKNFEHVKQFFPSGAQAHIILADLGVSSPQIDFSERGFSFRGEGPLDMRMDQSSQTTAKDIILSYSQADLEKIFFQYGEEPKSRKLAQCIVQDREQGKLPLGSTTEFAQYVARILNYHGSRTHPATRTFQALRIATNRELEVVETFLQDSFKLLAPGGKIGIISFHSLEDRLVKSTFRAWESSQFGKEIPRGGVVASDDESKTNPRSRSARLRVFQKGCEEIDGSENLTTKSS
jgi:16S rRNA (cytosine1402-N4)-methyltransferase